MNYEVGCFVIFTCAFLLVGVLRLKIKDLRIQRDALNKECKQNLQSAVALANELHDEGLRKNEQRKRADKAEKEIKRLQKELKTYKKSKKL